MAKALRGEADSPGDLVWQFCGCRRPAGFVPVHPTSVLEDRRAGKDGSGSSCPGNNPDLAKTAAYPKGR